jgi:hypothetical protein
MQKRQKELLQMRRDWALEDRKRALGKLGGTLSIIVVGVSAL